MLKKLLRRGIRKMLRWLSEKPAGKAGPEWEGFAYFRLNQVLLRLIAEGRGILRPSYTWGVLHAAHLAKALGIERISVIEFGVAGGNGLVALDRAAIKVGEILGLEIDVYGFDLGKGLPGSRDYRDMPNLYGEGDFSMDPDLLRRSLSRAELILGPVAETVSILLERKPAPIGFISFDLDYYTSTIQSFKLLEADYALVLPRIHCYFDVMGFTCSDFAGERLAISEFNRSHTTRKISPIYGLKFFLPRKYRDAEWAEKFYLAHFFDHPLYGWRDGLVRNATFTDLARRAAARPAIATSGGAPGALDPGVNRASRDAAWA